MPKDYYETLGVNRSATKDEIRRAYKELAKKFHPDINKDHNAAEKFKEINEAASVLGDDQKRANYDRFGTTAEDTGQGFGGFDFSDFMSGESGFDFESIFDQFFSGGLGGRSQRHRVRGGSDLQRQRVRGGSDLQYELVVTLEDVAFGAEKEISVPKLERCDRCDGTGAESSSDVVTCPDCHGSGMLRRTTRTAFGIFQQTGPCTKCQGTGRYIKNTCSKCDGTGVVRKNKKIKITIPKGAEDGMNLRVRGEGQAGQRGTGPGDLYILIHVRQHKQFERVGDDLSVETPLSFVTAALGGEIEVPTLEGKATLKIPQGTQSGTVFRMRGKGIPHLEETGSGDELVKVTIQVPEKISKRQRELLKEFDKESDKSGFFNFLF
jgi:molecular chaperone DnaJ